MAFDTSRFLDSFKTLLVNNASTLALSLTSNVTAFTSDSVVIGTPIRVTRQIDQYPCIILTPKTKTQEFDEIGMVSSKTGRQVVVSVDILALTQCASDYEDSDKQARILAKNIETIVESNLERAASTSTVSDGWHLAKINNVIYDGAYSEKNQTYQAAVKLEAQFTVWGDR